MSRERRVLKGKERARVEKGKEGSARIRKGIPPHQPLLTLQATLPIRGRVEALFSFLQVRYKPIITSLQLRSASTPTPGPFLDRLCSPSLPHFLKHLLRALNGLENGFLTIFEASVPESAY